MDQVNNVVSKSATASADTKFNLVTKPMWFHSLNIVCLTNGAYYGDRESQEFPLAVNDVTYFEHPVDLNEIFFKNQGAGLNAKIVAVGALILKSEKIRLGIPTDGV